MYDTFVNPYSEKLAAALLAAQVDTESGRQAVVERIRGSIEIDRNLFRALAAPLKGHPLVGDMVTRMIERREFEDRFDLQALTAGKFVVDLGDGPAKSQIDDLVARWHVAERIIRLEDAAFIRDNLTQSDQYAAAFGAMENLWRIYNAEPPRTRPFVPFREGGEFRTEMREETNRILRLMQGTESGPQAIRSSYQAMVDISTRRSVAHILGEPVSGVVRAEPRGGYVIGSSKYNLLFGEAETLATERGGRLDAQAILQIRVYSAKTELADRRNSGGLSSEASRDYCAELQRRQKAGENVEIEGNAIVPVIATVRLATRGRDEFLRGFVAASLIHT